MERPEIYTDNYNSLEEWIELRKRNEEFVYPQFFVPFREWMKDIEQKSDMEIKELLRILLQPYTLGVDTVDTYEFYKEYVQDKVNKEKNLQTYVLGESSKLKKEVRFHQDWIKMIQDNTVNILGWIQYEKVKWLQNNNPEVPGLIYKLVPMNDKMRKLSNVRKLWEGVLEVREIRDVFTGREIVPKQYDVDHFIPWSFVMNDELWNLMPMESSLNSSKSNRLPKWNPFFKDFAYNQYILYGMIHENANIHKRFEVCYGDNLHSIWAGQELYRKGNTEEEFYNILEKNMLPVYESARRQGYEIWEY